MNDKKDRKRITKLEERRQTKLRREEPFKAERWFEFTSFFDPNKAVPLELKEAFRKRMFVLGTLEDIVILQVPEDSPPQSITHAMEVLARRGVRSLAFTDNIRFMRIRMCSPEEEELLTEQDNGSGLIQIGWPPASAAQATRAVPAVNLEEYANEAPPEEEEASDGGPDDGGGGEGDSGIELPSERYAREKAEKEDPDPQP